MQFVLYMLILSLYLYGRDWQAVDSCDGLPSSPSFLSCREDVQACFIVAEFVLVCSTVSDVGAVSTLSPLRDLCRC